MATPQRFRFRVESVFTLPGHGTTVMGTIEAGAVRTGDHLRLVGNEAVLKSACVHVDAAPRVTGRDPEAPPLVALVVPGFAASDLVEGAELIAIDP